MKRLLTLALTVAMVTSMMIPATAASKITIKVNNQTINTQGADPYIDNANRTLVPLRFVADNLSATTDWDATKKVAKVTQDSKIIEICIPCKWVKVNGQEIGTDSYGSLNNNRTFVPLRLIAETLNATVNYDSKTKTVNINTVDNPYKPGEYARQDVTKMNLLPTSIYPENVDIFDRNKQSYDGAGWDWNVSLIKEGVSNTGFGIEYSESVASAVYAITTNGEWIRSRKGYPSVASFEGNHIGKTIDKVFFSGGGDNSAGTGYTFLVDIPNIKIEK